MCVDMGQYTLVTVIFGGRMKLLLYVIAKGTHII